MPTALRLVVSRSEDRILCIKFRYCLLNRLQMLQEQPKKVNYETDDALKDRLLIIADIICCFYPACKSFADAT
jgi:hypothetical protein